SRRPARGADLDPALFRHPHAPGQRRPGPVEAAFLDLDQLRAADHQRQPRGGARLQVAARKRAGMKSLFWLLAVFAAAVALVVLGRVDAGYVLFIFPPYRVELTMLFFALAAVASFLVLYAVLRL